MNYDIIGDIHGHAAKLRALLRQLDYREQRGTYRHPSRTAVFLGDFIDRGPEQVDVVHIVRRMVDAGMAKAVMGNHEFNAVGWATADPGVPGNCLRAHNASNANQHAEFLAQFNEGSVAHTEAIAWFKTLPLYLDLGGIRVVHAWWHQPYADEIAANINVDGSLNEAYLVAAFDDTSAPFKAAEGLLKGLEIQLATQHSFCDHHGIARNNVRLKWWLESAPTLRESAIVPKFDAGLLPDLRLPSDLPMGLSGETPIFIGHYWLTGTPALLAPKLACLDFSIAGGGPLIAYRWEGEPILSETKFWIEP